jgi:hypothetical protein
MPQQKDPTNVLSAVLGKVYEEVTAKLTPDELKALDEQVRAETAFPSELGEVISQGTFNFICPETHMLVSSKVFDTHGNVNTTTSETEVVMTVLCGACRKEHPISIISLPKLFSMPLLIEADGN